MERDNRAMHLRAVAAMTGEVVMEARCKGWINRTATRGQGNKCCKFSAHGFLIVLMPGKRYQQLPRAAALPMEVKILV